MQISGGWAEIYGIILTPKTWKSNEKGGNDQHTLTRGKSTWRCMNGENPDAGIHRGISSAPIEGYRRLISSQGRTG